MTTSDPVTPQRRRFRVGLPQPLRIGAMLVIVACAVWPILVSHKTRRPLPDAEEIRSIEASLYSQDKKMHVTFQVPRSHWNAVVSALLPARRDTSPAKWAGLGDLNFKLVKGDSYFVSLYDLDGEPGAFSAGPTFENRVYYRGGSNSDLKTALADALNAAPYADATSESN